MSDGRFLRTTAAAAAAYLAFTAVSLIVLDRTAPPASPPTAATVAPTVTADTGTAGDAASTPDGIRPSGCTVAVGDTGLLVERLQTALATAGFDPGPVDGMFGERTRRAVADLFVERFPNADRAALGAVTGGQVDRAAFAVLGVPCER